MPERSLLPIQDPESLTQMLDLFIEQQLNGPLSNLKHGCARWKARNLFESIHGLF